MPGRHPRGRTTLAAWLQGMATPVLTAQQADGAGVWSPNTMEQWWCSQKKSCAAFLFQEQQLFAEKTDLSTHSDVQSPLRARGFPTLFVSCLVFYIQVVFN